MICRMPEYTETGLPKPTVALPIGQTRVERPIPTNLLQNAKQQTDPQLECLPIVDLRKYSMLNVRLPPATSLSGASGGNVH